LLRPQILAFSATPKSQQVDPSFYPRRRPEVSRIDLQKTLAEQLSLLRVVDNRRYPEFFEWRGRRVRLEVQPESTPSAE